MLSDALDRLCDLVEIKDQGLTIVEPWAADDTRVAFRTIVQLDGDVLVMIDPAFVGQPDFEARHAAHLEQVSKALGDITGRLRRAIRNVSWVGTVLAGGLSGVLSFGSGLSELLMGEAEQAVSAGIATLLGAVAWPLGRRILGRLVRRRLDARAQFGGMAEADG